MNLNLKTYKTIDAIETLRKEINEALDKRASEITLLNEANELSQKSFGYMKEAFENLSPVLFESNEGRSLIKRYTEMIKNTKSLQTMHVLYESIRKTNKNSDIDFFIDKISSEDLNLSENYHTDCEKLGNILAEAYIMIGESAKTMLPTENSSFDSAVEFIAENKRTLKNLSDFSSAVKILRENIEANAIVESRFSAKNIDSIAEAKLKEFNEKYAGKLSAEEESILKELSESKNPAAVFDKYKTSCKNKMMEAKNNAEANGDMALVNKLSSLYEQVSKKTYSPETIGEDICNLVDLSNIFE